MQANRPETMQPVTPAKVVRWERTCIAHPSQWEGELSDGRMFYGRYRHGQFSVSIAETVDSAVSGSIALGFDTGGYGNADMDDEEFMAMTAKHLLWDWSGAVDETTLQVDDDWNGL